MRHFCLLLIAAMALLCSVGNSAEYKDSQLLPFGAAPAKKSDVKQSGWFPQTGLKNPIKPVGHTISNSWDAVSRTGTKAMNGTKDALTPTKRITWGLPKWKMPRIPRPNLHLPSWNSEPEPQKLESVGDWLKLPHALPE